MRALKQYKEKNLIFFDIETARVVKELEIDSPLFDSWNYKVNKKGEMSNNEVVESYRADAGIYPEFSKIICIVVGIIKDGEIILATLDYDSESEILVKFNALLRRISTENSTLVGFVNKGFDTPFAAKRMIINGIEPYHELDISGLKPWHINQIDLAEIWKMGSSNRASLINIATAFGLPSPKDDISGADVSDAYWDGELKRISKYCRADVATTINIYRKMLLKGPLKINYEASKVEPDPSPVMKALLEGGSLTAKRKETLIKELVKMSDSEKELSFVILESIVSGAKGKKTKLTKTHVNDLKKEVGYGN